MAPFMGREWRLRKIFSTAQTVVKYYNQLKKNPGSEGLLTCSPLLRVISQGSQSETRESNIYLVFLFP